MNSLTRKLHGDGPGPKELPFELKYNCLRHLNDELLKRLAESNRIIDEFKRLQNGKGTQEEEEVRGQQEGSGPGDGQCVEPGGPDPEEPIRETAGEEEEEGDDQRALRRRREAWENYVETD
jgi:hypothetical protein